ncbi:fructosamine kinase family protein [Microbispora sp. H10830]|uniref:fructosamine kinase family protein n=1 Tax=Microbispora sp. H10830 TaxID=2729109 RepID=UPI00160373BB|nr:fructosamine kinase family protein [Microbispora sp. H10830]
MDLLLRRLQDAGFAVQSVRVATGGVVAMAGMATMSDGSEIFAKTLPGSGSDVFEVEAEGLRALRELGGAITPGVLAVTPNLLVLQPLKPCQDNEEQFWEDLARVLSRMHTTTISDRFGWHRDGWLGRMRQDNTWDDDGYSFFAQRRILRWLPEPLVEAAFDREDRRALEHLCAALPELVPPQPPVLTHGDLWCGNIASDQSGAPVLLDPAVSYSWAEADLSMLWCSPRPPASDCFFAAYTEITPLADGWRDRMPLFHLRELLSIIAHGDDNWGAARAVREIAAPFAHR